MKKCISVLLVIGWMIFIFVMSSFTAGESSNQSGSIVNLIVDIFNISNVDVISFIVRKMAHFIEYFVLGLLVVNMIRNFDKKIYIGVIICILYAISDEVHQLFVIGRSCELMDIFIDSFGSCFGIMLFNMVFKKIIR